jgi:hypothetical protein
MTAPTLHCSDPSARRREARVRGLNGIDYVEPSDDRSAVTVRFIADAPRDLGVENVRVDAPPGAAALRVDRVRLADEESGGAGAVRVVFDRTGDPVTYALGLVEGDARGRPSRRLLHGFDPRYTAAEFTFAAGCPSDLDCLPSEDCPPQSYTDPQISYLAKDYASFRQLILDRLALIMPGWTERHVPDLELMLVEVLAYVGDYLSYYQDAVATEAYLGTARRRISVRRHARLVDYRMHEGCNARAWVTVVVAGDLQLDPGDYRFLTGPPTSAPARALRPADVKALPPGSYDVFEPIGSDTVTLRRAHNAIELWTWGEEECCVPAGAMRATLRDAWADVDDEPDPAADGVDQGPSEHDAKERDDSGPEVQSDRERELHLTPGDVLIFEEMLGPRTGSPNDADPEHRQAVRLTAVIPGYDDVWRQPVVEVEWAPEDALRFPLCVSTIGPDCRPLRRVTLAHGNVILVDHGRSIAWCGDPPEKVPIDPAPLGEADCDPCGPPNARRLLEGLLALTEGGQELAPDQLALVADVVGSAAALVAGFAPDLDADGLHDEKAKAAVEREGLESFLAERGRFPVPYTYELHRRPVTHRVPFPREESVAASQARYLESLEQQVHGWVLAVLHKAQRGEQLSLPEIVGLKILFDQPALRVADLVGGGGANDANHSHEITSEALGHLLDRWPTLLRRKAERLHRLARRARAGYVLGADELAEIEETWGAEWANQLDGSSPRLAGPACAAMEQDPRKALAALALTGDNGLTWQVRPDLLDANATDRSFVVEVDDEGNAHLRFGDGENGRLVDPGTMLSARYRVGNGTAGNVGSEVISRIEFCNTDQAEIVRVRNPLPACGGVDPESTAEVKLFAPLEFRRRFLRAVTASDYATAAGAAEGIQRAAAELSWTGSWYEADVALDPFGAQDTSPQLEGSVVEHLSRYRRIGHDVRVRCVAYVPIDLGLRICVLPHYQRGEVEQAALETLGNRTLADGTRGLFHPDNVTFAGEVALSAIVASVQAIPGVQSVDVLRFERLGAGDHGELARGVIRLGPFEIARLDNDARHPENGRLILELRGGR